MFVVEGLNYQLINEDILLITETVFSLSQTKMLSKTCDKMKET